MRDQRRRRVGPGHTGNVATALVATHSANRFSSQAPAPAAPPLPAQPPFGVTGPMKARPRRRRRSKLRPTQTRNERLATAETGGDADSIQAFDPGVDRARARPDGGELRSQAHAGAARQQRSTAAGSAARSTAELHARSSSPAPHTSPSMQSSSRPSPYRGTRMLCPSRSITSISRSSPAHRTTMVCGGAWPTWASPSQMAVEGVARLEGRQPDSTLMGSMLSSFE